MLNKTQIGGVQTVDFDKYGERTSPDIKLTAANLDTIPGSKGLWDQAGIRIDLGAPGDGQRLRATAGGSTLSDIGQNGTDGTSIKGVVTGTRFTIDGPLLSIGGKEYSLSDVTEVHATS